MSWRSISEFRLPASARTYVDIVGGSGQVIPFLATCAGLKPAMDDWVPVEQQLAFGKLLDGLGLCWTIDSAFEFMTGGDVPAGVVGGERLNTTRAFGHPPGRAKPGQRQHIFIASNEANLARAVTSGWYPLVTGNRVVEKPWIDHFWFGAALGFPECCRTHFAKHNDWWSDNSLYQAWRQTKNPQFVANTLLKYTGFGYAAYLPCAFDCAATVRYGNSVRALVHDASPDLGRYADSLLKRRYLVLSEWEIVSFGSSRLNGDLLAYEDVSIVPTDRPDGGLFRLLLSGNRIAIRDDVLVVFRGTDAVGTYQARSDRFGPQVPFLVDFR